jgi:hypothetical protein
LEAGVGLRLVWCGVVVSIMQNGILIYYINILLVDKDISNCLISLVATYVVTESWGEIISLAHMGP